MDVSPDNINTASLYNYLCSNYDDYTNVYVIPIICIEFVVLRWLHIYFSNLEAAVPDAIKLLNMTDLVKLKQNYGANSLEILSKRVLLKYAECYKSCFLNKANRGNFYTQSCPCNLIACTIPVTSMPLQDKADSLYAQLPMYLCNSIMQTHFAQLNIVCNTSKSFVELMFERQKIL